MNLLLLHTEDRIDERFWQVRGPRCRHLRQVLGVQPGRRLRVGWLDGPLGIGTVQEVTEDRVLVSAEVTEPAPEPTLSLILAVPRPKMLKKLLPGVAAFGLRRLVLLRSWRTQPVYMTSPTLAADSVSAMLEDGMSQGRWTRRPEVLHVPRFESFFELATPETERWVADPNGETDVATLRSVGSPTSIAIGPEGGWLPYEVERFRAHGFVAVRSGTAILRTDVACIALLAQAALLQRRGSEGRSDL